VKVSVSSTGDTLNLGNTALVVPGISNSTYGTNLHYLQGAGVTDIDGNFYSSVIINDQEWMSQNLRVSKFNDGSVFTYGITNPTVWNFSQPAYCSYQGNISNDSLYGKIYNYYAARGFAGTDIWISTVNDKNLCPTGWHVPRVVDYLRLFSYINSELYLQSVTAGDIGFWNDFSEGLKSFNTWPLDTITEERNIFGFSAQSLGYLNSLNSSSTTPINPERAYFFTKEFFLNPSGPSNGYGIEIQNSNAELGLNRANLISLNRSDGAFIRCIKD
jgi:uncharacterized protein (TIGR02145 family)